MSPGGSMARKKQGPLRDARPIVKYEMPFCLFSGADGDSFLDLQLLKDHLRRRGRPSIHVEDLIRRNRHLGSRTERRNAAKPFLNLLLTDALANFDESTPLQDSGPVARRVAGRLLLWIELGSYTNSRKRLTWERDLKRQERKRLAEIPLAYLEAKEAAAYACRSETKTFRKRLIRQKLVERFEREILQKRPPWWSVFVEILPPREGRKGRKRIVRRDAAWAARIVMQWGVWVERNALGPRGVKQHFRLTRSTAKTAN
jgi:hypothetical protein